MKKIFMNCMEAVSYTHLDVYKRQGFAWGLEWYFLAGIGSGNGFGKDKKKERKVVLCL